MLINCRITVYVNSLHSYKNDNKNDNVDGLNSQNGMNK